MTPCVYSSLQKRPDFVTFLIWLTFYTFRDSFLPHLQELYDVKRNPISASKVHSLDVWKVKYEISTECMRIFLLLWWMARSAIGKNCSLHWTVQTVSLLLLPLVTVEDGLTLRTWEYSGTCVDLWFLQGSTKR